MSRFSHTKFRNCVAHSSAFTLSEVLVTLTILGIVASITVPGIMQKQTERTNKTKIKKALATYEAVINKIVIENNYIRSTEELDKYIKNDANCSIADNYFKATKKEGCVFRTADGLWWDIGKNATMSYTMVSFKKEDLLHRNAALDVNNKAFYFITDFDEGKILRIEDMAFGYESSNSKYIMASAKTWAYINNKDITEMYKFCEKKNTVSCVKINEGNGRLEFYNANGIIGMFVHDCKKPGKNCTASQIRENIRTKDQRININISCGYQGSTCNGSSIYVGDNVISDEEKEKYTNLISSLRPDFEFDMSTLTYEKTYSCSTPTKDYTDSSCKHVAYYIHVRDTEGNLHSLDGGNHDPECFDDPNKTGCRFRDYYDWTWHEK